jgi:hypothetical protein
MLKLGVKAKDTNILNKIHEARTVVIPTALLEDIEEFMEDVIEDVEVYPPETQANSPPPPYYIRGVGQVGRGGTITKPSQQLGTRWGYETTPQAQGVDGVIFNRATYSGWVQDRDLQTPWHARTGWKTVQTSAEIKISDQGAFRRIRNLASILKSKLGL